MLSLLHTKAQEPCQKTLVVTLYSWKRQIDLIEPVCLNSFCFLHLSCSLQALCTRPNGSSVLSARCLECTVPVLGRCADRQPILCPSGAQQCIGTIGCCILWGRDSCQSLLSLMNVCSLIPRHILRSTMDLPGSAATISRMQKACVSLSGAGVCYHLHSLWGLILPSFHPPRLPSFLPQHASLLPDRATYWPSADWQCPQHAGLPPCVAASAQ